MPGNTRARLAEEAAKEEMIVKGRKRKVLEMDVEVLKKRKFHLEQDIRALLCEADEKVEVAERSGDFTLVARSNAMRRSAKEKEAALQDIVQKIIQKSQELKDW